MRAKLDRLLPLVLVLACGESEPENFESLLVPNLEPGRAPGGASNVAQFAGAGGGFGRGGAGGASSGGNSGAGLGGFGANNGQAPSSGGFADCTPDTDEVIMVEAAYGGSQTGLHVCPGQTLVIEAYGRWCWGGGNDCSGPSGTPGRPLPSELPVLRSGSDFGTLVGVVAAWTFEIGGSSAIIDVQTEGDLVLWMNDRIGAYDDNSGSLTVAVSVYSGT